MPFKEKRVQPKVPSKADSVALARLKQVATRLDSSPAQRKAVAAALKSLQAQQQPSPPAG